MEIEEVFLDEDAVAIVEGGFPFFHKALADFDRQKFSSQILVFLQNLSHFAFDFELGDSPLPLLIFLALVHSFLRRIHGVSFPFTPILLNQHNQPLILIMEMLNLDFHLVNFGIFGIFFI